MLENTDKKDELARTVRDQLDKSAFRRAMRSGYEIFSNGERFDELLDRLEECEKRQT